MLSSLKIRCHGSSLRNFLLRGGVEVLEFNTLGYNFFWRDLQAEGFTFCNIFTKILNFLQKKLE